MEWIESNSSTTGPREKLAPATRPWACHIDSLSILLRETWVGSQSIVQRSSHVRHVCHTIPCQNSLTSRKKDLRSKNKTSEKKEKSEHVNSYDSLEERHVFGYKTTSTPSKNLTQVPSLAFKFCSKQFFLSRYPLLLYLPFCFSHQISSFDWHYYLFDSLDSSQVRISLIWHMIINFMH